MQTTSLTYEGSDITFQIGDTLMVKASEMAKPFNKLPTDYLRLDSTKEFLAAYMEENSKMGNPIVVQHGGVNRGTWMNEDIAVDFAQWLSPRFKVWVNARIKELMKRGTPPPPQPIFSLDNLLSNPDVLITVLQKLTESQMEAAGYKKRLANLEARRAFPNRMYPKSISAEDIQFLQTQYKPLSDFMRNTPLVDVAKFARESGLAVGTLNLYACGNGKKRGTLERLLQMIPQPSIPA